MRICPLLVALLLYGAVVAQSASFRAAHSDVSQYERCVINRRQIMETARRYYKAQFETKLLIYKIRLYRQQLLEKRLRYLNFLQRMKLRHNARIQRRVRRFQRQVNKVKVAYRKRLRSVTKRYQRRVIRKLKAKPLSNRRIRLIKKAFFRRGIISKRAAEKSIRLHAKKRSRHIRSRAYVRKLESIRDRHASKKVRCRYSRGCYTQTSHARHEFAGLDFSQRRSHSPRSINLRLRSKHTVDERMARFKVWRQRLLRGFKRELNFRRRENRFQHRRNHLKLRYTNLMIQRRALTKEILSIKMKRNQLGRRLNWLKQHRQRSPGNARLTMMQSQIEKITLKCNSRILNLLERRAGLKRQALRMASRTEREKRRMRKLRRRLRQQIRDTNGLFLRIVKHLTRWRATKPEIFKHVLAVNKLRQSKLLRSGKTASVSKPLTRSRVRQVVRRTRRYLRADEKYFRKILESRDKLSVISKATSEQKQKRAKIVKQLLAVKLRIQIGPHANASKLRLRFRILNIRIARLTKQVRLLQGRAAKLQSRISSLHDAFAANFRTWTSSLMKTGFPDHFKVLAKASNVASKVRNLANKRRLRKSADKKLILKQNILIKRLSVVIGVPKSKLRHMIKQNEAQKRRAQLKEFTERVVKRVTRIQRKLTRAAKRSAIFARHKLHLKRLRFRLKRRLLRMRERRHRLKRRIRVFKNRRTRFIRQVRRLTARKLVLQRQFIGRYPSIQVQERVISEVAAIDFRTSRNVRKIAALTSRINALKDRRVLTTIRVRKLLHRRHRYDRRIVAVNRRIKRQAKRLKLLVKKNRSFARRVVQKGLVSRRVIRRALKSNRDATRRRIGQQGAKRILKNRLSSTILTQRLREKKTVNENIRRFTSLRHRFARNIQRTLVFHYRTNKFKKLRKLLKHRIAHFALRRRGLYQQISQIRRQRRQLTESVTSLGHQRTVAHQRIRSHIAREIARFTKSIRALQSKRYRLRRRITRTTARRRRLRYRMAVLRKRMRRQLLENRRLFIRAVKKLTRWKATDPKIFHSVSKKNKRKFARSMVYSSRKRSGILKSLTRSRIRSIMKMIIQNHRSNVRILKKTMICDLQLSQVRKRFSKVRRQLTKYNKISLTLTNRLRGISAKDLLKNKKRITGLIEQRRVVRAKIDVKKKKMKILEARTRQLQTMISNLKMSFAVDLRKWTMMLMQIGLPEFVKVMPQTFKAGAKVQRHMVHRRLQRIRYRKQIARQTNLINKLAKKLGISKIKLSPIIKQKLTYKLRAHRKAFVKRVVKRVTRIQKKLKRTAKKVAIVARHKRHLTRLGARLRRRLLRIRQRGDRLKRRIREAENSLTRLVRRVRRLTARKRMIQQQLIGRYATTQVQGRIRSVVNAVDFQINRNVRKIAGLKSHIVTLKNRKVLMKMRTGKVIHRQHRLKRRMAAVKLRIKRQTKRLKDLIRRKRMFIGRVVTKKLVSRRVVRRVSKPSQRLIRRYVSRHLSKKIVKQAYFQNVRESGNGIRRISISGAKIALPSVNARTGHVSKIRTRVSLRNRDRRQLQKEKAKVTRLLDARKLPTIAREIMKHPSRVVSRSDVKKVTRILGSNKLLKVTSAELLATQTLQSSKLVPVRSLERLQSILKQELRSLRRKLATAAPAFNKLVQRTNKNYEREESQVSDELHDQLVHTKEVSNQVIHQQKWLYRTEYQTLVSTQQQNPDEKGFSVGPTLVHTEETVAV